MKEERVMHYINHKEFGLGRAVRHGEQLMVHSKAEESMRSRPSAAAVFQNVLSKRAVKVRDLVKQLEENGWRFDRMKGSHRQYRHSEKPQLGTVRVAGHLSEGIPKGTLAAIVKQTGLKK